MRKLFLTLLGRTEKDGGGADLKELTRLVRRYAVEQQQVPKDLLDLVTLKYIDAIPAPPAGQKLVLDRKRVEVRLE
jgi:hypothetical protein